MTTYLHLRLQGLACFTQYMGPPCIYACSAFFKFSFATLCNWIEFKQITHVSSWFLMLNIWDHFHVPTCSDSSLFFSILRIWNWLHIQLFPLSLVAINLRTMVLLSITNIKLCLCLLHSLLEHFNWVKRIRFLFFSSKLNTNHGGEKVHAHAKLNGITCITSQE